MTDLASFSKAISTFGKKANYGYNFTMLIENGLEVGYAYRIPTKDFNALDEITKGYAADFIIVGGNVVKDKYLIFESELIVEMLKSLKGAD